MPKKKQEPPTLAEAADMFARGMPMTTLDLAVYLRTTTAQLDTYASRGGGPVYSKPGAHRLYQPKDVQAWLDGARYTATGTPVQEKRAA